MIIKKTSLALAILALLTSGCVYNHPDPKEVKDEL